MAKRTPCAGPIPYTPPTGPTFAEVRAKFQKEVFDEGRALTCPCCNQLTKVYKRKLYGLIVYGLIKLIRLHEKTGTWVHRKELGADILINGGDFSKLEWWGLTEQKRHDGTDKRCSGLWRPTQKGLDFAYGRIKVPSHSFSFDSTVLGFSDEMVTVREALGKKFDYEEVMANPFR